MKVKIKNLEKEQSLVVVTIYLMVFFGMLALVLDGGYSYFMRRNAQNAADAGALAAADIWCETENWDLAYNEGKYYAEDLNGADDEESIITSPGERKVRVETNITFDTFFGRFLGWDQITAVASATAGCYPPGVTEGVLPVAWSCKEPVIVEPYPPPPPGQPTPTPRPWDSADCELLYGDSEYPYQGQMYIIMDANKLYDDLDAYASCQDPPANSETCTEDDPPDPCFPRDPDLLDCDIDNDGINDVLAGGERSWLDLDEDSSSAIELKEWVLGVEDPQIFVNVWLRGAEGGKTVVYQAAEMLEDSNVIIPVYN
ncbi:MAG: hypothetical protein KAT29_14625, partial [Anaerolineales bacterium]|nr:hypothetical protein [Anaerolineales bacterium]